MSLLGRGFAARTLVLNVAIMIVFVLAVPGCRHQDLARQRLETRDQHIRNTARVMVETERSQPEQLEKTLVIIDGNLHRDAELTRENVPEYGGYLRGDWNRWRSRPPVYGRWIHDATKGRPENLEPTAIWLFY